MLRVWLSIVFRLRKSSRAMSALRLPASTSAATSRSRGESDWMPSASRGAVGPRRQVRTPRRRSSRVAWSRRRWAPKRSNSSAACLSAVTPPWRSPDRASATPSIARARAASSGAERIAAPRAAVVAASSGRSLGEQDGGPRAGGKRVSQRCGEGRGGGLEACGGLLGGRRSARRSSASARAAQTSGRSAGMRSGSCGPPAACRMAAMPASGWPSAWMRPSIEPAVLAKARFGGEAHGFARVALGAVGVAGQLTRERQVARGRRAATPGCPTSRRLRRPPLRPRSPRASRPSWISGCSWVASSTGMK